MGRKAATIEYLEKLVKWAGGKVTVHGVGSSDGGC